MGEKEKERRKLLPSNFEGMPEERDYL